MFKKTQSGFTFLELLAYLAIYGTISASIIAGISAMFEESNVKHDLSDMALIEKEIRNRAAILNNFSTDKSKSTFISAVSSYNSVSSLQEFLCVNGLSFCQTKNNKNSTLQTSQGTPFTVLNPGTVSNTGYSFAIKFVNLPYNYCVGFADEPWGNNIIGLGIGDNSGTTFYPYGTGTTSESSEKIPSTKKCPKNNTASLIIYYR